MSMQLVDLTREKGIIHFDFRMPLSEQLTSVPENKRYLIKTLREKVNSEFTEMSLWNWIGVWVKLSKH